MAEIRSLGSLSASLNDSDEGLLFFWGLLSVAKMVVCLRNNEKVMSSDCWTFNLFRKNTTHKSAAEISKKIGVFS